MAEIWEKLGSFWKTREDSLRGILQVCGKSLLIVFCTYLVASTLTAMSMFYFTDSAIRARPERVVDVERPKIRKTLNFREVRRSVVDRNIFNSDGELPDEEDPSVEGDGPGVSSFNANAPCQNSSLPLELFGTIISGDGQESFATVREKGYQIADVYRPGDPILGNEQAIVYAVESRRLVLNNNGSKECIEMKEDQPRYGTGSSSPAVTSPSGSQESPGDAAASSSRVTLEVPYVEDALGPGFAKILESGRLVPFNRDGNMIGFKLIGAKNDSLWRRIGLNSGDVITSVNGISMAQPDKGFSIFEALQNEREIRVEFLKKGNSPSNISVEIK